MTALEFIIVICLVYLVGLLIGIEVGRDLSKERKIK